MATTYVRNNQRHTAARSVKTAEYRAGLSGSASHRKLSIVLWIVQAVLALLFLLTGSMKLLMPSDMLAAQRHCQSSSCGSSGCAKCLARWASSCRAWCGFALA